jgi:hypothetical protein
MMVLICYRQAMEQSAPGDLNRPRGRACSRTAAVPVPICPYSSRSTRECHVGGCDPETRASNKLLAPKTFEKKCILFTFPGSVEYQQGTDLRVESPYRRTLG